MLSRVNPALGEWVIDGEESGGEPGWAARATLPMPSKHSKALERIEAPHVRVLLRAEYNATLVAPCARGCLKAR